MQDIYRCKLDWGRRNICVPLVGRSEEEILEETKVICAAKPDLCEWRIDAYEKAADAERVKRTLQKIGGILGGIPVLCTFRTLQEGGFCTDTEDMYFQLLSELLRMPETAAIDVEVYSKPEMGSVLIQAAHRNQVPVIASNHDFERTPEADEIVRRLSVMASLGADVVKTAFMPEKAEDVDSLIEAGRRFREQFPHTPMILISMGELGQKTRIEIGKTGSCLTFASAGKKSAPGQMSVQELREMWKRQNG